MSYKQKAIEYSLRVTDKEGLEKFLREKTGAESLSDALSEFWEDVLVHENGKIESNHSFTEWHTSDDETLEQLAPFIEGCIRWIGEDNRIWEDVFRDGRVTSESPVWPSDYFYIEKWSELDIPTSKIPKKDVPAFLAEAKKRIIGAFEDLSDRNEQIYDILEEMMEEKTDLISLLDDKIRSGELKYNLEEDFEPVDSQGHFLEGSVNYQGKDYPIFLPFTKGSYRRQIAEQLFEKKVEKHYTASDPAHEKELNVYAMFYLTFNDDNFVNCEQAIINNGGFDPDIKKATETLRKKNFEWFEEIMEKGSSAEEIIRIFPGAAEYEPGIHICRYCGNGCEGKDEDLLCKDCRELFGHTYYHEL